MHFERPDLIVCIFEKPDLGVCILKGSILRYASPRRPDLGVCVVKGPILKYALLRERIQEYEIYNRWILGCEFYEG